ncbi:MAG: hypothetical protein ACJA1N_002349 [Saprospiraceae bacterium]
MSERNQRKYESVYSKTVRAGKRRTYFFDVKQTKGNDYYLTITESKKRFEDGGYERHKIFLYKEDFNRFLEGLNETVDHVKSDLMPDYDYDEYTRRHEEYELNKEQEQQGDNGDTAVVNEPVVNEPVAKEEDTVSSLDKIEDDLAW